MSNFKVKDLIGCKFTMVAPWCDRYGYSIRIASDNEEGFINTSESNFKRVNVVLEKGIVKKAYLG